MNKDHRLGASKDFLSDFSEVTGQRWNHTDCPACHIRAGWPHKCWYMHTDHSLGILYVIADEPFA